MTGQKVEKSPQFTGLTLCEANSKFSQLFSQKAGKLCLQTRASPVGFAASTSATAWPWRSLVKIQCFSEAPSTGKKSLCSCLQSISYMYSERSLFFVRWIANPSYLSPNPLLDKSKLDIKNNVHCMGNLRCHSHG